MALGITEANAVNVLLRAMYGAYDRDPLPAPSQQAVDEAAELLAGKAPQGARRRVHLGREPGHG